MEICSILVREPFRLLPEQILELNRWIVSHVYFRKRDRDGMLVLTPKENEPAPASYRDQFFAHWRRFDIADAKIRELWAEHQEAEKAKSNPRGRK